jgi:pyridoxal phosphate enzyme (YggS family)
MSVNEKEIKQRLIQVRNRIIKACKTCGRDPSEVRLLLATKTQTSETVKAAVSAGADLIGENRVQEALLKWPDISSCDVEFHFIGHLQSNKIKDVLTFATCIQSVDRLELAQKIQDRLEQGNKKMDVLIQVNTSNEPSKSGCLPEEALQLLRSVSELPRIHIKGLMTIGVFSDDETRVRKCFRLLADIREQAAKLQLPGVSMEVMSMGMSGDIEAAVYEGSTMIRVGSAVFGPRQ